MLETERPWCLVLSGGGAKGVYHIGVWKALTELGVPVQAFIGASIGAIIAGFLAQGRYDDLKTLGETITVDSILALPEELTENGELKLDRDSIFAARDLFRSLTENRGLDTSPLRNLIGEKLSEAAIRASGRDLGIVTVNLTDLQPREVFVEAMEEGRLLDYLMASAAFPGFEQPVIGGKKYVDGGLHDNIPYAMARKRGYRRIIVSDISGAGRNRKPSIEGSMTIYIRNSIDMGGVLDFDRSFLSSFAELGYLDTLRTFGRLEGYAYFLEANEAAENEFAQRAASAPEPDFPEAMRYDRRGLLKRLECAASILELDRIKVYSYGALEAAIEATRKADEARIADLLGDDEGARQGMMATIREAIVNRSFDGSPYYYWRLVEEVMPKTAGLVLHRALAGFYPELPGGLDYLAGRWGA